ncbi:MAG: ABC transporter permease [Solirubrobacteraceae bacterium]
MSSLVHFYSSNASLLLQKTVAHLGMSALAVAIAIVTALPCAVYLGHRHRGSAIAVNVANAFRALPSLALIAIGLTFFGPSLLTIEIALVALAIPPILVNAVTAVDTVDPDAVESARGMGMTEVQILARIELPQSWPLIFAGIRTASVFVIATATLRGIAGGGGLGDIVANQPSYHLAGLIGATILVVVLAFALDGLLSMIQRALTPRGLRRSGQVHTILPLSVSSGADPTTATAKRP